MLDEQHARDDQQDMIRYLRARLDECEAQRAGMAAAAERERSGMRAEIRMLKGRILDILALLEAQQQAAGQAAECGRAEGWKAGYEQRAVEEAAQVPPRRDGPGGRHLRVVGVAVPAVAAAGRVVRSKLALAVPAAAALVLVVAPPMHTLEVRGHVPGPHGGPSAVSQAFTPSGAPSPPGRAAKPVPPGQAKKSSPPGHGHGNPSPGNGQPSPTATAATGTPAPAPDPAPAGTAQAGTPSPPATDTPSHTDTPAPSHSRHPDPQGTPYACTPAP